MKIIFIQLYFSTLIISTCFGQYNNKHNYNWQFGFYSTDQNTRSFEINFINDSSELRLFSRDHTLHETNSSICDTRGRLLLYTNGCNIYNSNHEIIDNGSEINYEYLYPSQCEGELGGYQTPESLLFLDFGCGELIYLVHQHLVLAPPPISIYQDKLLVTKMLRVNDQYRVIAKNEIIIEDTLAYGQLEAVPDGKGGYWVINSKLLSNTYYLIKFDSIGNISHKVQSIGGVVDNYNIGFGQAVFSPDYTTFARYCPSVDSIFIFAFNNLEGSLTNYRSIYIDSEYLYGGISISPNSKYLYLSTLQYLYQYHLLDNNPQSTETLIAEYDGFMNPAPTSFYLMQLAPDGKIYMIPNQSSNRMHVIHRPNEKGINCEFIQHNYILPSYNPTSIPNFLTFFNSDSLICDSTVSTTWYTHNTIDDLVLFNIFPNPVFSIITIESRNELNVDISVYSIEMELCVLRRIRLFRGENRLDLPSLPNGIYMMVIDYVGGKYVHKLAIRK